MSKKHDAGKGDSRRPSSVSQEEIDLRWKMAFGDRNEKEKARQDLENFIKGKARRSS